MKRTTIGLVVASAMMSVTANAQEVARYKGTDGDWFNPRNWSTGRVPGRLTDVVIGGRVRVTIDPARNANPVEIRDLWLREGAILETRPGTQFSSRHEVVADHSSLIHRSSVARSSGSLIVTDYGAINLNPTPKMHRDLVLKTGVTVRMGLGGAVAANPAAFGSGHHATITADHVLLAGRLQLGLKYGFQPRAGQTFQIVTANRLAVGRLDGLGEGAMAARFGEVGLFISYRGGDGNDVVLTARRLAVTP